MSGQAAATRGRILILTAPTGSGHDVTAEALAEALCATYLAVEVRVHAPFAAGMVGRLSRVDRCYDAAIAHAPRLWGLFYHATNHERAVRWGVRLAAGLWGRRLGALVRSYRPDIVVSVHPLCTGLASALAHGPRQPRLHCVVTDLVTVHRAWVAPGTGAYYVATEAAAAALYRYGVAPARVHIAGLPLRRDFARARVTGDRARRAECAAPAVLLLGGGRASRLLEYAARALLASPAPLCLTIVCGKNGRLRRRLARITRGRAIVLGWRPDIAALMRASDIVVTKAGSVTLAEAFSQARPVLTYHLLAGQEEGNVPLLVARQLGTHALRTDALPGEIGRLLSRVSPERSAADAAWWGASSARIAALIARDLPVEPV